LPFLQQIWHPDWQQLRRPDWKDQAMGVEVSPVCGQLRACSEATHASQMPSAEGAGRQRQPIEDFRTDCVDSVNEFFQAVSSSKERIAVGTSPTSYTSSLSTDVDEQHEEGEQASVVSCSESFPPVVEEEQQDQQQCLLEEQAILTAPAERPRLEVSREKLQVGMGQGRDLVAQCLDGKVTVFLRAAASRLLCSAPCVSSLKLPSSISRLGSASMFYLPKGWTLIEKIGSGAFGTVVSCEDEAGSRLAVKKCTDAFRNRIRASRVLHEVKILKFVRHQNLLTLIDVFIPASSNFNEIYIITELMDTDLFSIIYSKQPLDESHHQHFLHKILCGLAYLHSACIIHRDLKPENILVDANCDLKICDFNMATSMPDRDWDQSCSSNIGTRWYRAPEILLGCQHTCALDIWSTGCILWEIIFRKALFPGKTNLDQVGKIVWVLGTPTEEDLSILCEGMPSDRRLLKDLPSSQRAPWAEVPAIARNLLAKMLVYNPAFRVTAKDALRHPYLVALCSPEDLLEAEEPMDWGFDRGMCSKDMLRALIAMECAEHIRPEA